MQYFGIPISPQSPLFLGIPVQYIVMWGYQVLPYLTLLDPCPKTF